MIREKAKNITKDIHKYVEKSSIMTKIMDKSVTPKEYVDYLNHVAHIYQFFEENVIFKSFGWISLYDRCMEDIEEIESAHTVKRSEVKDETNMYLNYLESMKDNKTVICAHAYVRYMADLFGGQIMKRQLTKAGYPTNVYDFYGDVKTIRGVIATAIEECDETLFVCESHHAFTCYALIL